MFTILFFGGNQMEIIHLIYYYPEIITKLKIKKVFLIIFHII